MTRGDRWKAIGPGGQPGIVLRCPVCTGPNYYAVLKTSGSRILTCPQHALRRLVDNSGLPRFCTVPIGEDLTCSVRMVVGDGSVNTCPNCDTALEARGGS